jgi:hypothetical protein
MLQEKFVIRNSFGIRFVYSSSSVHSIRFFDSLIRVRFDNFFNELV